MRVKAFAKRCKARHAAAMSNLDSGWVFIATSLH